MPAASQAAAIAAGRFDDELVPGTRGIHAALLRRIEPFPTVSDLVPYSPEYVRGWTVERYQVDLHQAHAMNREALQSLPGVTVYGPADMSGRTPTAAC